MFGEFKNDFKIKTRDTLYLEVYPTHGLFSTRNYLVFAFTSDFFLYNLFLWSYEWLLEGKIILA